MEVTKAIRVLLVKNDRPVKILLESHLPAEGQTVVAVRSGDDAVELLNREAFDVSQLELALPGFGSIETRRRQHGKGGSDLVVVDQDRLLEQEFNREKDSTERIQTGEYKYLTKPISDLDLAEVARQASREVRRRKRDPNRPVYSQSGRMHELMEMVRRVAAGNASVLVQGETGTGKSLIAREIHNASPRAEKRLVAINCGAFQDQLLESELFGHEKGAFTGAVEAKKGLFEVADRGTLFLDEIAEMTPAMQAKLLQVLDEGEMRRVGGTQLRKVAVRIVAASNKDLQKEVKAGRFREDLLFRLNVITLRVPPLRERPEDIPELVELFLDRYHLPGQRRKDISPEALRLLKAYSWPGNVRELANCIEGLILLAPGEIIQAKDLPQDLRPAKDIDLPDANAPLPLSEVERLEIIRALHYTEGKKAPAARLLGIDVKTLNNKIRGYEIELP